MSGEFSTSTALLVDARSEFYCEIMARGCTWRATQKHHRRPRAMGGSDRDSTCDASNALATCAACHQRVEYERTWALKHGFLVAQTDEPADVPVWWRCALDGSAKRYALLLSDGTMTHTTERIA